MRPPRGPAAPPSPPPAPASAAAPFSRYAALLSLGGDIADLGVRDAVEAVGEQVGWANLGSNSWRSEGGMSQNELSLANIVSLHFKVEMYRVTLLFSKQ